MNALQIMALAEQKFITEYFDAANEQNRCRNLNIFNYHENEREAVSKEISAAAIKLGELSVLAPLHDMDYLRELVIELSVGLKNLHTVLHDIDEKGERLLYNQSMMPPISILTIIANYLHNIIYKGHGAGLPMLLISNDENSVEATPIIQEIILFRRDIEAVNLNTVSLDNVYDIVHLHVIRILNLKLS